MIKKALLGFVCAVVLVMVPGCGKKNNRVIVETRKEVRETPTKVVKTTVVNERLPKKTTKKPVIKEASVGNQLRAEEINEEDKD